MSGGGHPMRSSWLTRHAMAGPAGVVAGGAAALLRSDIGAVVGRCVAEATGLARSKGLSSGHRRCVASSHKGGSTPVAGSETPGLLVARPGSSSYPGTVPTAATARAGTPLRCGRSRSKVSRVEPNASKRSPEVGWIGCRRPTRGEHHVGTAHHRQAEAGPGQGA